MKKLTACFIIVLLFLMTVCGNAEETGYYRFNSGQAKRLMAALKDYVIVDVQAPEFYEEHHIPGAINIPRSALRDGDVTDLSDKDQIIFVYDYFDYRSREAAEMLVELGYTQVATIGGLFLWTGEIEGTGVDLEEEEDDPYGVRDYADPEDFYYDYYDEFDDYEEAEEFYYDYGGW